MQNSAFKAKQEKEQKSIKKKTNEEFEKEIKRIEIPVVVHFIYKGLIPPLFSKLRAEAQIKVLNQDFNNRNPLTKLSPKPFKKFIDDSNVKFKFKLHKVIKKRLTKVFYLLILVATIHLDMTHQEGQAH